MTVYGKRRVSLVGRIFHSDVLLLQHVLKALEKNQLFSIYLKTLSRHKLVHLIFIFTFLAVLARAFKTNFLCTYYRLGRILRQPLY